MKLFALVLAALALLAGFAGGAMAFSSAAKPVAVPAHVVMPHHPKSLKVPPLVRWAPCRKPAVRQGRACVTHVVHTVTLPAPVSPVSPVPAQPAPASASSPYRAATPRPATARPAAPHYEGGDDGGGGSGGHDD